MAGSHWRQCVTTNQYRVPFRLLAIALYDDSSLSKAPCAYAVKGLLRSVHCFALDTVHVAWLDLQHNPIEAPTANRCKLKVQSCSRRATSEKIEDRHSRVVESAGVSRLLGDSHPFVALAFTGGCHDRRVFQQGSVAGTRALLPAIRGAASPSHPSRRGRPSLHGV